MSWMRLDPALVIQQLRAQQGPGDEDAAEQALAHVRKAMPCKERPALTMPPDLARRADEAGLNALPAPRQVLLDGWLLRFADGCTRRANSVNPLWPGDALDTDGRIRRCAALYAAQGLPCLFRVSSFSRRAWMPRWTRTATPRPRATRASCSARASTATARTKRAWS